MKHIIISIVVLILILILPGYCKIPEKCMLSNLVKGKAVYHIYFKPYKFDYWVMKLDKNGNTIRCYEATE